MKNFLGFLFVSLVVGSPLTAFAQDRIPSPGSTILAGGTGGIIDLLTTIANWLFTILLLLAVIFIVLAAYRYLFSGGGEEVGKAHKMLLFAAVAIAVAFLARGIVYVVRQLVTTGGSGGGSGNSSLQIQYENNNVGVRVNL